MSIVTHSAQYLDPPSLLFNSEGICAICGMGIVQHRVVHVEADEILSLNAMGLKSCMYETGGTVYGGFWYRHICLKISEDVETMTLEEFEELYS